MEGVRKRKVPQCVCPVAEHTGCQHPWNSLLLVAGGGARETGAERNPRGGSSQQGGPASCGYHPSYLFHLVKLQPAACSKSAVGLRQSSNWSIDVESCIPGVLEIWTISVGVSGRVRKDSSVDPSGEMM